MSHLCKYRKYLKACTVYDLRNMRIQNELSSCLQGSAGLHDISLIPQEHSSHFPESPGVCLMPLIFLTSGDEFFFPLPGTQCLDQNLRIREATLNFQNRNCNSFHCFSWFCIPRVLSHGVPCFNPLDGITHP